MSIGSGGATYGGSIRGVNSSPRRHESLLAPLASALNHGSDFRTLEALKIGHLHFQSRIDTRMK